MVLCNLCSFVHHQKQQADHTWKCMERGGASFNKGDFRSVSVIININYESFGTSTSDYYNKAMHTQVRTFQQHTCIAIDRFVFTEDILLHDHHERPCTSL